LFLEAEERLQTQDSTIRELTQGISTDVENFRPNPIDHVLGYGQKIASPPVVLPKLWKEK
jgi:hypothetical protein